MTSVSAALVRAKEPLQLVEHELPLPAQGEVTVRIEACGLGLADWNVAMLDALPFTPLTLGCEAVGRVESTGQRVGITPLATSCGTCRECSSSAPYRCAAATWHGFSRNGALCSRGNFAAQHLVPLPEGDAAALAVLMGSGQAAFAAVQAAGDASALGIFGLGGVGHLALQLAGSRAQGFDPDPARAGEGPSPSGRLDAAVVCVPSAQAIQRAFSMLRPGGRLVLAADSPTGRLDLSLHALVARGVTVVGTSFGGSAAVQAVLAAWQSGALFPRLTRLPLRDAPAQLYALRDGGHVGRLVFIPE